MEILKNIWKNKNLVGAKGCGLGEGGPINVVLLSHKIAPLLSSERRCLPRFTKREGKPNKFSVD